MGRDAERVVAGCCCVSSLPSPEWKDIPAEKHDHPTQKPVAALKPLIEAFSQTQDLVLDPFCVSGSTLLAAKILNRRYFGIELDPKHHAAATRRVHPEGIRGSEAVYAPQLVQASRPVPPYGGALKSSLVL